jgi:hypothetical protein
MWLLEILYLHGMCGKTKDCAKKWVPTTMSAHLSVNVNIFKKNVMSYEEQMTWPIGMKGTAEARTHKNIKKLSRVATQL